MIAPSSAPSTTLKATARPKASIVMITFNHGAYIEQAIASVISQRTTFPFELIIGEDCSTDNTRAIVQKYASARPDILRPIFQQKNVGMHANGLATSSAARGEFIALLEGDDYWTSPHKLQRAVELLEANPDCCGCYHFVDLIDATGARIGHYPPPEMAPARVTFDYFLRRNEIPTPSLVFRRSFLPEIFPAWGTGLRMCDWPMLLTLTSRGDLLRLDATLGVHRRHAGGVWSRRDGLYIARALEELHERILKQFPLEAAKYSGEYRKSDAFLYIRGADVVGDYATVKKYFWRYLFSRPQPLRMPPNQTRAIVRAFIPWIRPWLPYNSDPRTAR